MIKNIMMNERDDDQKLVEDEFHDFRGKNQKNPTFSINISTSAFFFRLIGDILRYRSHRIAGIGHRCEVTTIAT